MPRAFWLWIVEMKSESPGKVLGKVILEDLTTIVHVPAQRTRILQVYQSTQAVTAPVVALSSVVVKLDPKMVPTKISPGWEPTGPAARPSRRLLAIASKMKLRQRMTLMAPADFLSGRVGFDLLFGSVATIRTRSVARPDSCHPGWCFGVWTITSCV